MDHRIGLLHNLPRPGRSAVFLIFATTFGAPLGFGSFAVPRAAAKLVGGPYRRRAAAEAPGFCIRDIRNHLSNRANSLLYVR
jgi:hypothetical protein